jgi:hypothetical protein
MNIIIYTLIIIVGIYFLLKLFNKVFLGNRAKNSNFYLFLLLIFFALIMAVGGKFIFSLPLTLASLAFLKLKGMSIFQLISLFRLLQTLKASGRFSFKQNNNFSNSSMISLAEAYKILNLDINKNVSKEDVQKAYLKIQKKIHPDISPETARLSAIVNEAREIILKNIS